MTTIEPPPPQKKGENGKWKLGDQYCIYQTVGLSRDDTNAAFLKSFERETCEQAGVHVDVSRGDM